MYYQVFLYLCNINVLRTPVPKGTHSIHYETIIN